MLFPWWIPTENWPDMFKPSQKDSIFCYLHSNCQFIIHHDLHIVFLFQIFFLHLTISSLHFCHFVFFPLIYTMLQEHSTTLIKVSFLHYPNCFSVAYKCCGVFSQSLFRKYDFLVIAQILTQLSTGLLWYCPALRMSIFHSQPYWQSSPKLADVIQALFLLFTVCFLQWLDNWKISYPWRICFKR